MLLLKIRDLQNGFILVRVVFVKMTKNTFWDLKIDGKSRKVVSRVWSSHSCRDRGGSDSLKKPRRMSVQVHYTVADPSPAVSAPITVSDGKNAQ